MEDQKIVKLLWQRAESAIEALAQKFGKRLMSIAMNILGVRQDAEESVNDTYLAVWNTVPPKKPDPLAGFVYATGRNISLDRLKYNTAEKRDNRYDLSIDELANCIPAPALEETVEARELGLAINRFLGTLRADDRALFLRRYWFGDPVRQIARDLGMRENTASVRLGRLRMQLRRHLVEEGYGHE
ncbi:MAG: sigma-70 family RNA polymerase sigma factor [Oscillospiraceae bacterium]|nr:sigma-70 family RNA polymerase sigma factor [Oscillospiraceae bacterium]